MIVHRMEYNRGIAIINLDDVSVIEYSSSPGTLADNVLTVGFKGKSDYSLYEFPTHSLAKDQADMMYKKMQKMQGG